MGPPEAGDEAPLLLVERSASPEFPAPELPAAPENLRTLRSESSEMTENKDLSLPWSLGLALRTSSSCSSLVKFDGRVLMASMKLIVPDLAIVPKF